MSAVSGVCTEAHLDKDLRVWEGACPPRPLPDCPSGPLQNPGKATSLGRMKGLAATRSFKVKAAFATLLCRHGQLATGSFLEQGPGTDRWPEFGAAACRPRRPELRRQRGKSQLPSAPPPTPAWPPNRTVAASRASGLEAVRRFREGVRFPELASCPGCQLAGFPYAVLPHLKWL